MLGWMSTKQRYNGQGAGESNKVVQCTMRVHVGSVDGMDDGRISFASKPLDSSVSSRSTTKRDDTRTLMIGSSD